MVGLAAALILLQGPEAGAPDFRVVDYQLDLHIDREHRTVAGRERIRLRSTTGGLTVVTFP